MACGIAADVDDDGNGAAANPPQRKGQSVVRTVIEEEGIVVDNAIRDAYVTQLLSKVTYADTGGVQELVDGLSTDSDMKIAVWAELPSNVRSFIKKLGK
tara:strand:- start:276 stop:572 length:297 start_codon:yes stop_codon:yes gene_type:complete